VSGLDAVSLEVLKNSFVALVDLMDEQIRRTCTSFVLYSGDCSCCLTDAEGNIVMQGERDIASHVGTLHLTAKAVLEDFNDDLHPGDVFLVNDPYRGGTHVPDVRVVRPIFHQGELIALTQSNGHWDDVGGSVPGSFDIDARDLYREGLRIPPLRISSEGRVHHDVVGLLFANMRVAEDRIGDLQAQVQATEVGEARLRELIGRWGTGGVLEAFAACQDYVERLARTRIAELPRGSWQAEDYIDRDPSAEEGLVPVRVKLSIEEDRIVYDLSGSAAQIGSFHNAAAGGTLSALIAGTKMFFPEIPLNSGFFRVIEARLPDRSVVNASPPAAVTGFTSGAFEKVIQTVCELWSAVVPERAIACSFNLEYMLIGGIDRREPGREREFIWHDWNAGGWGARADRDGYNAGPSYFGAGLMIQPFEGQERLCPVLTGYHRLMVDSGGPGKHRGGCGVEKSIVVTGGANTVASYCCDRERSVVWGMAGGLPGVPHGATMNPGTDDERFLGACFAGAEMLSGDLLSRPASGGGGIGDPLERRPGAVLDDVIDGYVSIRRAALDYGVVIREIDADMLEYEVDEEASSALRADIAASREEWMREDPMVVAERVRSGQQDILDAIRQHGVIIDRHTGAALPRSTAQFRDALHRRSGALDGEPV
jgi:N-methylhydantoinase B